MRSWAAIDVSHTFTGQGLDVDRECLNNRQIDLMFYCEIFVGPIGCVIYGLGRAGKCVILISTCCVAMMRRSMTSSLWLLRRYMLSEGTLLSD